MAIGFLSGFSERYAQEMLLVRPSEQPKTDRRGEGGDAAAATPATDRRRLNERLRAEWIAGAEEEWRKRTGRPMTAEELERVLRRYPGDV